MPWKKMKKLPKILVISYLVLVVIALIPIFTEKDALSAVFAVMLTLPWSWLIGNVVSGSNIFAGLLVIIVGAVINASIIGTIARWVVNR